MRGARFGRMDELGRILDEMSFLLWQLGVKEFRPQQESPPGSISRWLCNISLLLIWLDSTGLLTSVATKP